MKKNREQTSKFFLPSARRGLSITTIQRAVDERTKSNKPGLAGRQALLARRASEPIKSREQQML